MQLVELQETVAGTPVAPYAVSYDPVATLASFAAENGITYPLLADVGSRVITELGLLNTVIVAEREYWGREMTDRHRGLPYPGTFVLDEAGVVVERWFERSHRNRPTGRMILEDLGEVAADEGAEVVATGNGAGVAATAWVASKAYFPNQLLRIGVGLAVEDGLHLYVPPIPDGYVELDVTVEAPDGVYWETPDLPIGAAFQVEGLADRFQVVDGLVDLTIPVHIHEDVGDVTPEVVIRYQACSDDACLVPDTIRLPLPLHGRPRM
jgi:peroxiredoxin